MYTSEARSKNKPLSLELESNSLALSSSFSRTWILSFNSVTFLSVLQFISCNLSSRALLPMMGKGLKKQIRNQATNIPSYKQSNSLVPSPASLSSLCNSSTTRFSSSLFASESSAAPCHNINNTNRFNIGKSKANATTLTKSMEGITLWDTTAVCQYTLVGFFFKKNLPAHCIKSHL